jgi:hypothetical protein
MLRGGVGWLGAGADAGPFRMTTRGRDNSKSEGAYRSLHCAFAKCANASVEMTSIDDGIEMKE